jgi:hypothetical protein
MAATSVLEYTHDPLLLASAETVGNLRGGLEVDHGEAEAELQAAGELLTLDSYLVRRPPQRQARARHQIQCSQGFATRHQR